MTSTLQFFLLFLQVLYVTVKSKEDHGYIVDIGTDSIQGFLSNKHLQNRNIILEIGEVIPVLVKRVDFPDKASARIRVSPLDFNQDFPKVYFIFVSFREQIDTLLNNFCLH